MNNIATLAANQNRCKKKLSGMISRWSKTSVDRTSNNTRETNESFVLEDLPADIERQLRDLAKMKGTDPGTEASRLIEEQLRDESGLN